MTNEIYNRLFSLAKDVEKRSYVPFSGKPSGVAILAKNGQIFTGCMIEVSNFTSSICAGKVALAKAMSEGVTEFEAVVITGSNVDVNYLCGDCRQAYAEFGLDISVMSEQDPENNKRIKELLPLSFRLNRLSNS
jgi:cytidine deaminase